MSNAVQYPNGFPKERKVKIQDVVTLYENENWDALYNVVICRDRDGKVVARFGQNDWCIKPITRDKYKNHLDFRFLDGSPELQLELKLIAYGWLFHKDRSGKKVQKTSTIISRFSKSKHIYEYLKSINSTSLYALSSEKKWSDFKGMLIAKDFSQGSLISIFCALNAILILQPWLKKNFGFKMKFESRKLAAELSNKEQQQTLVIPERLSDDIYGKAIELVNQAYPSRGEIAKIVELLQQNYLAGKSVSDKKIKNGGRYTCTDNFGNIIDNHKYALFINDNQPKNLKDIIKEALQKTKTLKGIKLDNSLDWKSYLGQVITACYICCGAFSGMRDSELGELTPKSYYKDRFEGRDYHMLQSRTFKLGEKREVWVAAPIAKKAIELISTLTKEWRKKLKEDPTYNDTVWCNQGHRSKLPVLITHWPDRLKLFCKQFGFVVTQEDYQECLDSNPKSLDAVKENVIVGKPWPLSPHQFRRSLAFYTIKHRLGTNLAIKQQFKHLYLSMTEWYSDGGRLASLKALAVDNKLQATLDEINIENTTNTIFKQWHSNEPLSGKHGKAIIKMREDIPHIYSSWDLIYRAVKKGTLTLHGTAHSYCKNGYKCDMDGVVTPQFCVNCESDSSIIDENQAKWWQKKHQNLVRYMALGEDISHTDRSHYVTQIRAAENVMSDFLMPFVAFEHDIKVTEL
ncbi:hypothetical protein L1D44_07920 [Shewanella sp. Isolate13]|uniref:hypothetical protein n=1 Tax=Shewanella sp. Isolate13 TaxID=2908531 RepID=UPI001EFC6E7B|nr:hypothetical protein [Shewanella sp. Isolate13]MCG9729774.1 hypothetical protein [Shewanella sp. Isolate13]